jgi:hypothetical protein
MAGIKKVFPFESPVISLPATTYFACIFFEYTKVLEIVNPQRNWPLPQDVTVLGINRFSNISLALVKFK